MSITDRQRVDALHLRAYFATVIGTARAPFGQRRTFQLPTPDAPVQLASNSTRDRVLFVSISRAAPLAGAPGAIFSQQSSASSNDFLVTLLPLAIFRFVLYPDESISIQGVATGFAPVVLSVGSEAY